MKVKFSLKYKIVIPVIIMNIVICLFMGLSIYKKVEQSYISMGSGEALSLAKLAASITDADLESSLQPGDENNVPYNMVKKSLNTIKNGTDIEYIYTVGMLNDKLCYIVDADENDPAAIGDEYPSQYTNEVKAALAGTGTSTGYIDKSSDGNIISSYYPIIAADGTVAGVVGVDYKADDVLTSLKNIVFTIIIIGVIIIILSTVIMYFIVRSITSGIRNVNRKIEELVNNGGDLTNKLNVASNDEVGMIAYNINSLLEYIHGIISNISDATKDLNTTVAGALETATKASDEVSNVSAASEQISASMQETSASITQIHENTNHMKSSVDDMKSTISGSSELVENIEATAKALVTSSKAATDEVNTATAEMSAKMNASIEDAKAVSEINKLTESILEISSQTNLLSLNASIEAARAGEAGRGFAVVASEIQKLANDSADIATQIKDISSRVVNSVTGLTDEAGNMLSFVNDKTIAGYSRLMDAGKKYQEDASTISDIMDTFRDKISDIDSGMNDVNDAINDVAKAAEESALGITDVASSSANITDLMNRNRQQSDKNAQVAENLQKEVDKFII